MKKGIKISLVALFCIGVGAPVSAYQGQLFYPTEGQSEDQQTKDISECRTWATTQTNYNPAFPPPPPPGYVPPPVETGPDGSVIRGAARGAAAGAVAGQIFDDKPGKGAAAGAATGALIGGMKRRSKRRAQGEEQQQALAQNQQQQMAYQQQVDQLNAQYNSAVGICMSGRGYNVG